jgi:hypothetical protein
MSHDYSDSTLKKLFSLSGNICAFKSCNSKIIDEFESVIGEICHIYWITLIRRPHQIFYNIQFKSCKSVNTKLYLLENQIMDNK